MRSTVLGTGDNGVAEQRGLIQRECPVCGFVGAFLPFGRRPRSDAQCPQCKSLERHRLMKLWFDRNWPHGSQARLIHFAPEEAVTQFVKPVCREYVTSDLMRDDVDLNLNIEALDLEDCAFDAILCSHVLEHVDDHKALAELYRILRPGGQAILAVPIVEGWDVTYENEAITSDADRLAHFGQEDHVRRYGRDFRDRVRAAAFDLSEFVMDGATTVRHGLILGERLFIATRPAG